jgi:hypothetical protein
MRFGTSLAHTIGLTRVLGSADRRAAGQQSNTDQQMALRTR